MHFTAIMGASSTCASRRCFAARSKKGAGANKTAAGRALGELYYDITQHIAAVNGRTALAVESCGLGTALCMVLI